MGAIHGVGFGQVGVHRIGQPHRPLARALPPLQQHSLAYAHTTPHLQRSSPHNSRPRSSAFYGILERPAGEELHEVCNLWSLYLQGTSKAESLWTESCSRHVVMFFSLLCLE